MGNFDPAPLDFSRMHDDIVQNRTFRASLPTALINSNKRKRGDRDEDARGTLRERVATRNPHVNPEWALNAGESYKNVFHKHTSKIPARSESSPPICATFQTKGACFEGCTLDHEKINRGTPLHAKFSKWCGDCRAGNF